MTPPMDRPPSGWLNTPPAMSSWLDMPKRKSDAVPTPFPARPIAEKYRVPKAEPQVPSPQVKPTPAPQPQPQPQPPPTPTSTLPECRMHYTTQGWLWGYVDSSGFVHPVERKP